MDNITHTLVGLLVGEGISRALPADVRGLAAQTKRNAIVSMMAIGSNVPDLDLLPSRLSGSKLEYLLHHRGHTHTILGAIAIGCVLLALYALWFRWRGHTVSNRDRIQLGIVAAIAGLLHVALDFANSYGVHPFWPFDNRWYYGDALFIVEPLFWAACAPLVFLLRTMAAKGFALLAVIAGPVLGLITGMIPFAPWVGLCLLATAMLGVAKFTRARAALVAALLICVAISVLFAIASSAASQRARALAAKTHPNLELLDTVLAPMPANPLCWQLILVQRDNSDWYVRRAMLALSPQWLAAGRCPSRSDRTSTTAPMIKSRQHDTAQVVWNDEIMIKRSVLAGWVTQDCVAAAFMRFARVPWVAEVDAMWVIGDARFDFERELNFAELELGTRAESCLAYEPPWVPPRKDLE